ncbi:DUF6283 family protein [Amycolatopsis sp. WAC 04182]|uniref:DUF6283 family protein n=1 Tax=Amycolatopsis sp. WAC 04182 TaxID=2203198 RepID=UPI0018F6BB3B|nr:DUF6283 family protein [Amycolatopsis sp. WAC 04182]
MSAAADEVPVVAARMGELGPPAEAPCRTCPYRRDVPSGVWDITEYDKLPRYDQDTGQQPTAVFQCHLTDEDKHPVKHRRSDGTEGGLARICAGWAGCHDGDTLLSLRVAVRSGVISLETAERTRAYDSPVPLWESGAAAAAHGVGAILNPPDEARRAIDKLVRVYGKTSPQDTAADPAALTPDRRPSEAPGAPGQPETSTAAPERRLRAAKAIHGFLIDSTGFDAGPPMIEQAAELADLLADAGLLTHHTARPPKVDAASLIRAYIVDSSGEDLGPLTTDQAEQLRDTLASAGLLGDGTFTPLPLTARRDDRARSS